MVTVMSLGLYSHSMSGMIVMVIVVLNSCVGIMVGMVLVV